MRSVVSMGGVCHRSLTLCKLSVVVSFRWRARAGRGQAAPVERSPQPSLAEEITGRQARLQERLRADGLDGALILHGVDLFYLSATRQAGVLWVPAAGEPALLVRRSLERARAESPLADVRPFPSSRELSPLLAGVRRVGLCFDVTRVSQLEWWRRQLPGREFADVSAHLRALRSTKSSLELAVMREGGRRIAAAMAEAPSFLREGMREVDVAAEIEARLRRAGNEGSPRLRSPGTELFTGLVVSGEAGAEPGAFDGPVVGRGLSPAAPVGPSLRAIRRGEPVLLDYTATFGGYVLDMTRCFSVGPLPPDLVAAFEVAVAIQDELAGALRPGAVPAELHERAAARAAAAGLAAHFMGPPGEQVRFVGHGVGLELDELPVLAPGFTEPLREGQVVAVEPKFAFPGRGAVGIENTWAVTARGGERLTPLGDALVQVPPRSGPATPEPPQRL
jgi:Xaa-Pro aminopeptidase